MVVDALRQLINDKLLQAGLRAGVRSTLSRNIWASTRGEHLDRQTYHNPVYPCNSSSRFVFEGIWSSRVFGKYAVDVVPEPTAEELSRNLGVSLKFNISGSTIFIGSNSSEEAVAEAIRRIDVLSAYYVSLPYSDSALSGYFLMIPALTLSDRRSHLLDHSCMSCLRKSIRISTLILCIQ